MTDSSELLERAKIMLCGGGLTLSVCRELVAEIIALHEQIREYDKALKMYADPGFYHACSFAFDRPTGGFDEDFSDNDEYDYPKPGKLARETLARIKAMEDYNE